MTSGVAYRAGSRDSDLLQRLQNLLYDYHALGRFEEARPLILWLMEIAEEELRDKGNVIRLS